MEIPSDENMNFFKRTIGEDTDAELNISHTKEMARVASSELNLNHTRGSLISMIESYLINNISCIAETIANQLTDKPPTHTNQLKSIQGKVEKYLNYFDKYKINMFKFY